MSDNKIIIDKCSVVITNEAYDKINHLVNSLPKTKGEAESISVDADAFFAFHYDQETNSIKISRGRGLDIHSCLGDVLDFAEIGFIFNGGYHVLEFVFKYNQSITLKHDGYYFYNDDDKFFEMMNFILGYNAFKIMKEGKQNAYKS